MLVLSRRLHERVVIPALGITIEVVDVGGGRVRLGVQAPPDVRVLREELIDQSQAPGKGARVAAPQLCQV